MYILNQIYYLLYVYWIIVWVKAQEAFDQLLVYWKILVSKNSLQICNDQFFICLFKSLSTQVITATMLFLQSVLYSSSFVRTLKNEIPGAALELWKLKIEQFSLGILKLSTEHKDNPLTLNFSKVSCTSLFIFHAGSHGLGSKNFRNSTYKEKTVGLGRVSRPSFCSLWLWCNHLIKRTCNTFFITSSK